MTYPSPYRGFSLVELLVVLTIMMTMIGLVGGNVIDGVARARAQTEIISVFSLLKRASVSSFATGQPILVSFEDYSVSTTSEAGLDGPNMQFEFLRFESQEVIFYRNGLPSRAKLTVGVRGIERELDFTSMFGIERKPAGKQPK